MALTAADGRGTVVALTGGLTAVEGDAAADFLAAGMV
jgi:hypothetical protein